MVGSAGGLLFSEPYVPFLVVNLDENSARDQFNFHHSALKLDLQCHRGSEWAVRLAVFILLGSQISSGKWNTNKT